MYLYTFWNSVRVFGEFLFSGFKSFAERAEEKFKSYVSHCVRFITWITSSVWIIKLAAEALLILTTSDL